MLARTGFSSRILIHQTQIQTLQSHWIEPCKTPAG